MRLRYLGLFGLIGAILLTAELALEFRASRRGYDTIVFGQAINASGGEANTPGTPEFGPVEGFPFRSRVVQPDAAGPAVWIASSSYAEDGFYAPQDVFPNLLEVELRERGHAVRVLNASVGGSTVRSNTQELLAEGGEWSPTLVLLYQMTNDLHGLANPDRDPDLELREAADTGPDRSWADHLKRLVERSTLFQHLSGQVTPLVTGAQLLPSSVPESADAAFARRVHAFLDAVFDVGSEPVLVTFAPRALDGASLSDETRTWMLRWNPHLSPGGYVETVARWNAIIREIAEERDATLIDLEAAVGGRSDLYRDYAHFTPEGHRVVADVLADALDEILGAGR